MWQGNVEIEQFFRLRHVQSGYSLHYAPKRMRAPMRDTEEELAAYEPNQTVTLVVSSPKLEPPSYRSQRLRCAGFAPSRRQHTPI